jgi:predicted O-methyltransferase YrrM
MPKGDIGPEPEGRRRRTERPDCETSLDFDTFFAKFGGSARTKNILPDVSQLAADDLRRNKRRFTLPQQSGLPAEFIRLCPWELEYLFAVARRAKRGIIEIGRFNGGSCFVMACAAEDVPIHSIDIRPRDDGRFRQLLQQHAVGRNVNLIVGDSQKTKYPEVGEADLLFIDGEHTYEGCMNDIMNWYDHVVPGGSLLFHDSYLGKWGVQDAIVNFMNEHPELQIIQSPFIGAHYWHYPAGSIAHLLKRAS